MHREKRVKDIEGIKIQNARRKNIPIYLIAILVGVIVAKIISGYIVGVGTVNTLSMIPTIMQGNKVVINKYTKDFKRGDIIVFTPPDEKDKLYTKRVIGVGGDVISIKDGNVYVNNAPITEGYILYSDSYNMEDFKVPEGEYFVLGDNRLNSTDSRHWKGKTIKSDAIVGKVIYIVDNKK